MKLNHQLLIALSLCASIATSPYLAQDSVTWEKLMAQGKESMNQGKLNNAESLYLDALKKVDGVDRNDPRLTETLRRLGDFYMGRQDFAKAERYYKRELSVLETLGHDYADMVHDLFNLGILAHHAHRMAQSEALFKRALAIRSKTPLLNNPPTASDVLFWLFVVYEAQGKSRQANDAFANAVSRLEKANPPEQVAKIITDRALAIQQMFAASDQKPEAKPHLKLAERQLNEALLLIRQRFGADHVETAKSLQALGLFYASRKDAMRAKQYFKQALATANTLSRDVDRSALNQARLGLADMYRSQGKLLESEKMYRFYLANLSHSDERNYAELMQPLFGLASALNAQKKFQEAEPVLRQLVSAEEKIPGFDKSHLASTIQSLAGNQAALRKFSDAEVLYKRSLAMYEKLPKTNDSGKARATIALAKCLFQENKYAEAEHLLRQTLRACEQTHGSLKREHLPIVITLAETLSNQGKYSEARSYYERAVLLCKTLYGAKSTEAAATLLHLSLLAREQGNASDSKRYATEALTALRAAHQEKTQAMADAYSSLALTDDMLGKHTEARQYFERAKSIAENLHDTYHVARILHWMGSNSLMSSEYQEAEALFNQSLKLRLGLKPADNAEIAATYASLALCNVNQGNNKKAEPLFKMALNYFDNASHVETSEMLDFLGHYADLLTKLNRQTEAKTITDRIAQIKKYYRNN